jgi:para-nitrobenzyl esterase
MFLTDAIYRVPALRLAHAQVAAGGSAYLNRFSGEPYGPALGACHAVDLAYVFGRLTGTPADTPENRAIADQLIQAWAEFIRDGDPGWAVYDAETAGNTRQFGGSADTITETPDARTWGQP